MEEVLEDIILIDTSEFVCGEPAGLCLGKERTRSFALFVNIPQQEEVPEVVFKECCYSHIVLASTTSTEPFKNDFNGFYHKRQLPNETCDFVLIDLSDNSETPLVDSTYGDFKDFDSIQDNSDLKTFVLSWKKVLIGLGEGTYKVVKRLTIAGLPIEIEYLVYNLKEYSDLRADHTVRIDSTFTGLFEKTQVDFTNSDFKDSIRTLGFFGNRVSKFEEDNLVNRSYTKEQISMKQFNEYKFQTNYIPSCISKIIIDFLLFSDNIRMNDYNLNNHDYGFKDFPVKLENNEGPEYVSTSRKVRLNKVFSDKQVNNIKRN